MDRDGVWARIQTFNEGRDPERLSIKYRAMQKDAFGFLRGSVHLFYQDWPQDSELNAAPLAWISGDLHLENFGTYKGDNRLTYFDINDFDEAVLAPCTWDLARFLCSLLVAAQTLEVEPGQAWRLAEDVLDIYSRELAGGKARWIERATATGMIRDLLKNLHQRSRGYLLSERTIKHQGALRLKIDGEKALAATSSEKKRVASLIARFAVDQDDPDFFRVMDVARRIAGIGSLGVERYVILVYGKGPEHHYLLDMKFQPGSSLAPYLSVPQPIWQNQAERVAVLQRRGQAIAPAFLSVIDDGERAYLLKELMPQQDRLKLRDWEGKLPRLEKVVHAMAELVAWSHMRTGGWQGAAIADQWQAFGEARTWRQPLMEYVRGYSLKVEEDWLDFKVRLGEATEPESEPV